MRRALVLVLAFATMHFAPAVAWAQDKVDFSGNWILDGSRSDAPTGRDAGAGPVTLVIKQTATQVTIETTRGKLIQTVNYKLDGSVNTNRAANGDMTLSKSRWDGGKLITEGRGALGESVVTTREIRSLDASGKTMTVEVISSTSQGSGFISSCNQPSTTCTGTKQVFTRTSS